MCGVLTELVGGRAERRSPCAGALLGIHTELLLW